MQPGTRRALRFGGANPLLVFVLISVGVLVALVALLVALRTPKKDEKRKLTMFCAAGIRVPIEEIAARYAEEYGVKIELQYGGSNSLLGQLEVNRAASVDLYLAGDDFYTDLAREKGLADEVLPIAEMWPVVVVKKGNPKGIGSVEDLLRDDVRSALGSPDQAAIGKVTKKRMTEARKWEALEQHVTRSGVFKPTVNEVANDVKLGAVDAGVVWNATAAMPQYRDELDVVELPELKGAPNLVAVAILRSSAAPTASLRFARYLSAADRGLPVFAEYGFVPVEGDVWARNPEITFFCGAVNRRAVDEVVKAFEDREGVVVNTIYNGCGILTATMRMIDQERGGAGFPDTYMACDRYYLENVKEWFQEDADISNAAIVIAVPKGNPANIESLEDLTKSGVRISVGEPRQCTIGALTRIMLQNMGIYDEVMENVVSEMASSSMLIPSVTTKSVDATIAYVTDTLAESDKIEAIRIDSPYAKAIQPFAIAKSSEHKYLGRRLFQKVIEARENFESAGFVFIYDGEEETVGKDVEE